MIAKPTDFNSTGGETYYGYFADELGSITSLYSESANAIVESYTYDAYGRTDVASAYGNPYRFAGRRFDPESKLYYYRARMYNPKLGVFLSCDPLGYIDSMNLYAYCTNNPTNFVDPWGERNLTKYPPSGSGTSSDPYMITYQDIMDTMENEIDRLNDHGFFSWDTFNFDNDYFHEEHNQDSFCIKGQGMYTGHDINYMVVGMRAGRRNVPYGLARMIRYGWSKTQNHRGSTPEERYIYKLGYIIGDYFDEYDDDENDEN